MRSLAIFGALLSFLVISPAQAQVDLETLKHVDIRDLAANPTYLSLTSQRLMELLMTEPAKFTGPAVIGGLPDASHGTRVKFDEIGARGPVGDIVTGDDGRARFKPYPEDDSRQIARKETRRYTIYSAEYHDILEEVVNKRFLIKLVLFIHDPDNAHMSAVSRGYFFRVFTVVVDWDKSASGGLIEILSMDNEIPLTGMQFQIVGDILDRKVILEDMVYGIKKVFPLGVGAFNIRAARTMDGQVTNLTREFQPGSKIHKVPAVENNAGSSTRMRTYPSYYRGRPFFGIIGEDGNYHAIGMHYQIDDSLVRGFVSHGCIRTRDRDLYQLDAVLNEGGQSSLPVRYHLSVSGDYARWVSPVKKEDSFYDAVVYSGRPSGGSVACKFDTYTVRRDRKNQSVHTVADGDCLTMTSEVHRSPYEVIDYLLGRTDIRPVGLYSVGREHVPIAISRGDRNATEGWNSDGGHEEVQRHRTRAEQFFGGLFDGIFKSREQRAREEYERQQAEYDRQQTIYEVQGDGGTARMRAVPQVSVPAVVPRIRLDLFAPQQQQQQQQTEPAVVPDTKATPVVEAVTEQPAVTQPAETAKQRERRLAIQEADTNLSELSGYIRQYCTPAPYATGAACVPDVSPCKTYCSTWKDQQSRWQAYRNKL